MTLNELKDVIDIDVEGSLARFSNFEPMYLKYLKRFVTEPTYDAMQTAIAAQDFKGIENTAHTLKGIAGNLGLNSLYHGFDAIVKAVRAGDNAKALELCAAIAPNVETARAAISQLD